MYKDCATANIRIDALLQQQLGQAVCDFTQSGSKVQLLVSSSCAVRDRAVTLQLHGWHTRPKQSNASMLKDPDLSAAKPRELLIQRLEKALLLTYPSAG